MKFDKITLSKIHPSDYNPRFISDSELNKLFNNLEEFGLVDPPYGTTDCSWDKIFDFEVMWKELHNSWNT